MSSVNVHMPIHRGLAVRSIKRLTGALALVAGLVSLIGWAADVYRFIDWTGSGVTMKANAAIAAAAAGSALLLSSSIQLRWLVRALGVFVAALGGLTTIEHLTAWDFGIDTFLFDEAAGALGTTSPGRMGPPASMSFLASGLALALLTGGATARSWSVGLGFGVLAMGTLALMGYLYGAEALYAIPTTGIAFHTAIVIAALGIGIIAANPLCEPVRTLSSDSSTGMLARRLLPLVIAAPVVIGWLRLQGQAMGLYDGAFGTALRTLAEVAVLAGLSWWSLRAIRLRDDRQQRADKELHDAERRLTDTIESINDAFVTFDSDWRFTYVNREAERLLGKPRSDLIGRIVWKEYPKTIGTEIFNEFHRAASAGMMVEVVGLDPMNSGRYFVNRIYPGADGGVSVYFQDVTQRKLAEDRLKDADRRKDEFLATLAHELRNPLAPIRSAAAVLTTEQLSESSRRWAGEVIGRQVRQMAVLLDDLLDISRVSRNRLEVRREWIDLTTAIESALETSRPDIDSAGHELAVALPEEPVYVNGDQVRLAQVFSNLLNNAAKYTNRAGHLRLTAVADGREVVVSVEDDGIGISDTMLPRVFEMFSQAKSALNRSNGGLGIGLSLARRIVEMHGGTITVRSAGVGRGSTFVVRLPRVLEAVASPGKSPLKPFAQLSLQRLLVVDDSRDGADTLALLLRAQGHDVQVAYDGEQALDLAAEFRPHAAFLDIGMPVLDGLEVCRRIRTQSWGQQMALIALTGWGQAEDLRKTREAGFDHHLTKPADAATLFTLVAGISERTLPSGLSASFGR